MDRSSFSPSRSGLRQTAVRLALLVAVSVGAAVLVRGTWADLNGQQAQDRQVALVVSHLLDDEHLIRLKQNFDDEVSRRGFDSFLKSLDPMKVYFYESDVKEFAKQREQLDDQVRSGNVSFGIAVFDRFLQRIDERVQDIDRLLAEKHDFSVEEEIAVDGDAVEYPKTPAEAHERWRKRIKYDLLVIQASEKDEYDEAKARERLSRRYHSFASRMHQTNKDDKLEMFLTSLTTGLDPHTTYMSPTTLTNFQIELAKELEGIGAALQQEDGYTVVSRVVPGGAADKAGELKAQDRIIGVGQGESGEIVDVVDVRLSDVVKKIRGPEKSIVRLEVIPGGVGEKKIYKITRAKVELTDQIARGEVIDKDKEGNPLPYKVGVINLPSFYMDMRGARLRLPDYRSTTRDCAKILKQFKAEGVDSVVLDLRNNGGGSLIEAISLTGLFIDQGPVVQVKDGKGVVDDYKDLDRGAEWEGPLVVLISKFSASASEIFAGAMVDYHRGLIVGDHATHGKGTVQSLLYVGEQLFQGDANPPNLGALKITMQQFYRPNGESTQKRGVLADVELPSITTHLAGISESDLDYAIDFDKVDPLKLTSAAMVDDVMRRKLAERSVERCKSSSDFQKVDKRVKRYLEQKDRKTITINGPKFLAERAEVNAEQELEKEIEKQLEDENGDDRPIVRRDFYFDEVLAVTRDYLDLLNRKDLASQARAN